VRSDAAHYDVGVHYNHQRFYNITGDIIQVRILKLTVLYYLFYSLRDFCACCRMFPLARIELGVGRRYRPGGQPEHGVERRHRVKAAVEPKHVFVQIGLQVSGCMQKPFQIGLVLQQAA
jgi:hypothetical protein